MAKEHPIDEARKAAANAPRSGVGRPADEQPQPQPVQLQAPEQEAPDPETQRLRKQVEHLQARLAELQRAPLLPRLEPTTLHPRRSPDRLYRVWLDGAKAMVSSVVVGPHERRAPPDRRQYEPRTYDSLKLFLEQPNRTPQTAAWLAYCEEVGLDHEKDRPFFAVTMEPGATVDAIVVPAVSPADAEHVYRRLRGVTRTDQAFHAEPVEDGEPQGPKETPTPGGSLNPKGRAVAPQTEDD